VPRIRSAKKKLRQARTHAKLNRAQRSAIKTAVKKARASVTPETVRDAVRALDRGASKGQIHPNTAARKKSRLARLLAKQKA
jgi:small subunit ribosomal protein S20